MRYLKLFENFYEFQQLVDDTKRIALSHGVRVNFQDSDTILYQGTKVGGGYFTDYGTPTIACAIHGDIKNWGTTLAHEASHMDQWIEKSPYWTDNYIDGKESIDWLEEWCNGKEFTNEQVDDFIDRAIGVELDCEKRTIEKLKKYNIPVNIEEEIQKANSYIIYYRFLKETRRWYDRSTPYLTMAVWSEMPKTFNIDYTKVPQRIKNLYYQHCLDRYLPAVIKESTETDSDFEDLAYCFANLGDRNDIHIEIRDGNKDGGLHYIEIVPSRSEYFDYDDVYDDIIESTSRAKDAGFKWWRSWIHPYPEGVDDGSFSKDGYYSCSVGSLDPPDEKVSVPNTGEYGWLSYGIPEPRELKFYLYPIYKNVESGSKWFGLKKYSKTHKIVKMTFLLNSKKDPHAIYSMLGDTYFTR